jgi:hypothetical protein
VHPSPMGTQRPKQREAVQLGSLLTGQLSVQFMWPLSFHKILFTVYGILALHCSTVSLNLESFSIDNIQYILRSSTVIYKIAENFNGMSDILLIWQIYCSAKLPMGHWNSSLYERERQRIVSFFLNAYEN